MAHEEMFGTRDRTYSAWHRRNSLKRFVGIEKAQNAHMIDLDGSVWVEFDNETKCPLMLIETAMDRGQSIKPYTVTKKLAEMAGLPACVLLYTRGTEFNPADTTQFDIEHFRYKKIYPNPETPDWQSLSPQDWAQRLIEIRIWSAKKLERQPRVLGLDKEPVRRVLDEICEMADHDLSRLFEMLERELGWKVHVDDEVAA